MRRITSHLCPALVGTALAALVTLTASPSEAAGIIKNPGQHPNYSVELEPHGLIGWRNTYWGGTGFGLGMHAVIPFLDNGPISKINNNMGIGFGMNWVHHSGPDYWYGYCGFGPGPNRFGCGDMAANSLMFPVFVQWNFFLTDIVSVFGEAGFGLEHTWWSADYPPGTCNAAIFGPNCNYSVSDFGAFPYFHGGGRFLFGDTVGLLVRIGYPYLTLGVSILL
jgi:hypothetical protein